jgi:hypothetical protein
MHLPEVHDPNPRETERRSSQQQDDKVSAEVLGLCTFEIDHSRHPTDSWISPGVKTTCQKTAAMIG